MICCKGIPFDDSFEGLCRGESHPFVLGTFSPLSGRTYVFSGLLVMPVSKKTTEDE